MATDFCSEALSFSSSSSFVLAALSARVLTSASLASCFFFSSSSCRRCARSARARRWRPRTGRAGPRRRWPSARRARTASRGSTTWRPSAWTFRAEASGLAVGGASLETARRGGAVYAVTIALETGYPLSGRVRSATGEPVAGLPVLVLPPREAMEAREPAPVGPVLHATTTGTDGRYRFDAIPRGAWSLAVRTPAGCRRASACSRCPACRRST